MRNQVIDFNGYSKFETIEELYQELAIMGHDYQLSYNGKGYFLSRYSKKGNIIFTIASNIQNENPTEFNSFEELLNNFKVEGNSLKSVILDIKVEYEF